MSREGSDFDVFVRDLADLGTSAQDEELLKAVLEEPVRAEDTLRQVEQVLETFRNVGLLGKDPARDLHLLLPLGRTYQRLSHLERAYESYKAALDSAERVQDHQASAEILLRIGQVLLRWRRWEEALDHVDRSIELYRQLRDGLGRARAVLTKGTVFLERGGYDAAAETIKEAINLARSVADRQVEAEARRNLGFLAAVRGQFDDALMQYHTCLAIFQEGGNEVGIARTLHHLGMVQAKRRDWNAAVDSFERAFVTAGEHGLLDLTADVYLARAEMMVEWEDSSMAVTFCARALDIYRKIKDRLGEADVFRLLGAVFAQRRQWAAASSLFRESIRLNEECRHPLTLAKTHRDMGKMYRDRGQEEEARAAFEAALACFRELGAKGPITELESYIGESGKA